VMETIKRCAMTSISFEIDWIIDLECSYHLMRDASKFSSLEIYDGNNAIEKEHSITFTNEGDSITLKNVYHGPEMKENLFSLCNVVDVCYYVLLVIMM